jgi:hypothetical protein
MERMRSPLNEREPNYRLDLLEEDLLVKEGVRKEIQILRQPVADLKSKARSAGKVKTVDEHRVPEGA